MHASSIPHILLFLKKLKVKRSYLAAMLYGTNILLFNLTISLYNITHGSCKGKELTCSTCLISNTPNRKFNIAGLYFKNNPFILHILHLCLFNFMFTQTPQTLTTIIDLKDQGKKIKKINKRKLMNLLHDNIIRFNHILQI